MAQSGTTFPSRKMLMPRYEFHSRKNLHEVARRPVLRRKLGRVLGRHFQWRGTEKIVIYDDGLPYSFFFEEYTPYGRGICGGIILHGAEDLAKGPVQRTYLKQYADFV